MTCHLDPVDFVVALLGTGDALSGSFFVKSDLWAKLGLVLKPTIIKRGSFKGGVLPLSCLGRKV